MPFDLTSIPSIYNNWLWIAGLFFGIVIALIGTVYMLSELLMNDKMKNWAKMELVEVFYSALILGLILFAIPVIDSVVQGSLSVANGGGSGTSWYVPTIDYTTTIGPQTQVYTDICGSAIAESPNSVYYDIDSCHIRLGIWFLREIFDEQRDFAYSTYLSYISTSMKAEMAINIEFVFEKSGFFSFTPWKGFYTIGNKLKEMIFDWTTKIMVLTKFQEVLLRFISIALFPIFIVVGALLRSFTFTRKLGGLLLAIALSLYFIFPAFYAFGAVMILNIKEQMLSTWQNSPANPNPSQDFDPPITNSMYITGTIPMIGQSINVAAAQTQLQGYEGLTPEEFTQLLGSAPNPGTSTLPDGSSSIMPGFNLGATNSVTTDQQAGQIFTNAYNNVNTYINAVSTTSSLDNYLDTAWSVDGPIDTLARLTFWSTMFGVLGIFATLAGIRSLSVTFGGDLNIAGLSRLI